MAISHYNSNTGIDADCVHIFSAKALSIYLFNKGKISREDFFDKLKEPVLKYSSFLKQRFRRYHEDLKERIEKRKLKREFKDDLITTKSHSLELSILNESVEEYNHLPPEIKAQQNILVSFETKVRDIAQGYCDLNDKKKIIISY